MRLPAPFIRLPLRFDVAPLLGELQSVDPNNWQPHPQGFAGNWSLPLVSRDGEINDDLGGAMQPTPHLAARPNLRAAIAAFATGVGRSRLMRLDAGARVSPHHDSHAYWADRVRIHVPLQTNPAVRFRSADVEVRMQAGEAWIFDTWNRHTVVNEGDDARVHLTIDTVGSPAFWALVEAGAQVSCSADFDALPAATTTLPLVQLDDLAAASLRFERKNSWVVAPPAEAERLILDLLVPGSEAQGALAPVLQSFFREWRHLWSLHGDDAEGQPSFGAARDALGARMHALIDDAWRCDNGQRLQSAMQTRLKALVAGEHNHGGLADSVPIAFGGAGRVPAVHPRQFERPVFIVCAPRSGSSLLFETLAQHRALVTLGGEGHRVFEDEIGLSLAHLGHASNRLTAEHATVEVASKLRVALSRRLRNAAGEPLRRAGAVRFLEKTPKNALRVPFLHAVFPDARFIFLYREPAASLASMIEAWNSGRFVTYPDLPGWNGPPWSLLLVPGWRQLRDRTIPEIAARQWQISNEVLLDDLARLPRSQWTAVNYQQLISNPVAELRKLCQFAELPFGRAMQKVAAEPLAPSRHTLTPPRADKWQRWADVVTPLVDELQPSWAALVAKTAAD